MPARVLDHSRRASRIDTKVRSITPSGGNVFADLGFDDATAASLKIKAQLMAEISDWIQANKLKQEEAARILAVSRPRVSDIVTGKTSRFSVDALIDMVERAGKEVQLHVS